MHTRKSNSNGNFKEFWDLIHKFPRFQGGFIWDFQDKALVKHDKDGNKKVCLWRGIPGRSY
ncbi:glycoside hydrolase family 2 TIM barrel-domain containing protein [Paenibacillus rhizoplanae]